jgi:hypothetical protein
MRGLELRERAAHAGACLGCRATVADHDDSNLGAAPCGRGGCVAQCVDRGLHRLAGVLDLGAERPAGEDYEYGRGLVHEGIDWLAVGDTTSHVVGREIVIKELIRQGASI